MTFTAVILVGGNASSTQFRPLSLDTPKPLFRIAGRPMIFHHIEAASKVSGLEEVFLIGDFDRKVFEKFIDDTSKELKVKITYLQEPKPLGTAGGLFKFKDEIFSNGRTATIMMHSDIACTFPLDELIAFHRGTNGSATVMGTKVAKEAAVTYGCYVADDNHRMLHYAEHPESYISDTINAGIAIFDASVFSAPVPRTPSKANLFDYSSHLEVQLDREVVSLERDVLPDLVSRGQVFVWEYKGFWRSVKNAGGAVYANAQYISFYASKKPQLLTSSGANPKETYETIGGVIVDPSAVIHPTARIGPNVYIGPGTNVGKGVRISNSIVQANVQIKDHACLLYSIVSNDCVVGQWTRLEGIPEALAATTTGGQDSRYSRMGITIFGDGVTANPEIIIRNCVVMSHKSLSASVFNEIIL